MTSTLDRRVGSWPDAGIEPVTKCNGEIDPDQIVARILRTMTNEKNRERAGDVRRAISGSMGRCGL